jgi:hypothetical protein
MGRKWKNNAGFPFKIYVRRNTEILLGGMHNRNQFEGEAKQQTNKFSKIIIFRRRKFISITW